MPTGAPSTVLRNNASTCRRGVSRNRASTPRSVRLLSALFLASDPCRFKRHSTAAQSAVATGILRQILLVIVLGVKELGRVADFRRDRAVSRGGKPGLISTPGDLGRVPLGPVGHVDRGAILGADIPSLPHALRGIVRLPERLEQILISDLRGIVNHAHHLRVSCLAGTYFLVGGVWSEPTCVADCGRVHPRQLPEEPLHAPEAAHAEHHLAQAGGKRGCDAMTVDEMRLRNAERCSAPGQCLALVRHYRFVSHMRVFLRIPRGSLTGGSERWI